MFRRYDKSIYEPFLTGDYKDINVPVGSDFEQTHIIVEADVHEIQPNICHFDLIK